MANPKTWQSFLEGDKEALSEIFQDTYDDLYRYGHKLTFNYDIVEDAIQDLFLKLWKNRLNLKPVDNIKPYLFKSLRNHIIDSFYLIKTVPVNQDDLPAIVYSHEDFIIDSQVTEEIRNRVIEALNQLPPKQREIIYLRYFEEIDFETIASIMDINVQSVRNTIHRGMVSMRELMLVQSFFIMLGKIYLQF
jgi:RNA polymerase sigma factor (sigma-70 family)